MKINVSAVVSLLLIAALTGCEGVDSTQASSLADATTPDETPTSAPSTTPTPPAQEDSNSDTAPPESPPQTPPPMTSGFTKCTSNDPNKMCLGVKIVAYKNSKGAPTITQSEVEKTMTKVNDVWKICNIAFQVEEYKAIYPSAYGLAYGAESEKQTTAIRREFSDNSSFLVAVTGPWTGPTIAWTEMPGYPPFGTIVEADYGDNAFTVGHEIGHYMGLYHIENTSNLMNPFIGPNTKGLTTSQCNTARNVNNKHWGNMFRH